MRAVCNRLVTVVLIAVFVLPGCSLRRRQPEFDFDPEMAVRLVWGGVPTINLPAPCRYLAREAGGVSHFRYMRDNLKLIWLHTRLLAQLFAWRWWPVWRARRST